ncbi:RDD family protein [Streptomyces sp. VRA16 Mangrove soil]|uniref:RDD family protein n=1 Tax=Streptomyces sp. VRA16 Mangrove soil TaxID=2817434 RepID=UPI001A9D1410|nr:RDD family protein [Streptomyces sp. VRA16 Mangrove soil]MBO1332147.1 RDD family protein [Streptomyces sp. VRA16 Mangrove soil]
MSGPEGRDAGEDAAGIVTRGIAGLVDVSLVALTGVAVRLGAGGARLLVSGPPFRVPEWDGWVSAVVSWVFAVCYLGGAWIMTGQSVGGRLMGVRVGDRAGRRLGPARALLRAALGVTFPLGLLWILFSRRRAALQDLLVGSCVRYDGR